MIECAFLHSSTSPGKLFDKPPPTETAAPQNAASAPVPSFTKEQILVSAKTVALVGAVGDVAAYGLAMNPSAAKAKEILEKEVQKWGRFTVAETPEQADLVMILVEGNRAAGRGGRKRVYYCRSIGSPLRSALLQSGLGSRSQGRQKWSC